MVECNWSNLPSVVLIDLYAFLSLKDRINASATCRRWREAFFFYPSKRKLHLATAHHLTEKNSFLVEKFSKTCRSLAITFVLENFNEVRQILKNWGTSRRLAQFQMVGSGSAFFQNDFESTVTPFLEECCNLTQLVLSHASTSRLHSIFLKNAESLKSLAISSIVDDIIEKSNIMIELLPTLEHLNYLQLDGSFLSAKVLDVISVKLPLKRLGVHLSSNSNVGEIPSDTWDLFQSKLPECTIRVTYYRMVKKEDSADIHDILTKAHRITHIRLIYCSQDFQELCLNALMRERQLLHAITCIWAISDPARKNEFMHHPYVVCAWRFKHLKQMLLSGSIFDHYDLVGMARMRSGLRLHIAKEDIGVMDGSELRPISKSELGKLKNALRLNGPWVPMDEKRFNDKSLPSSDRLANALRQVYLADFAF